jgi:PST family polysaccharide transporter
VTSTVPPSIPPDPLAPADVASVVAPVVANGGGSGSVAITPAIAPALGHTAARGAVWMALQSVLSKVAGIAGQLILAWLLAREDFGLVSLAYAWTALPSVIQQIGAREVLVRRGGRGYRHWVNAAFWMMLAFGLLAAGIMVLMSGFAGSQYLHAAADRGEPAAIATRRAADLRHLILLVAAAAPLTGIANLPVALLERQLRFRFIAASVFAATVGTTLLSILFASPPFRLGAFAMILPLPIAAAGRLVVLLWATRPRLRPTPHLRRWRYIFGGSAWVLVGYLFGTCITQGDFMVLGLIHPPDVGGLYFFAFNLSIQTIVLFALSSYGVLFSTLSRLRTEPERQTAAFLSSARVLALVGVPVCLIQAALADAGVRSLFAAKWYTAIPVIQVLSAGMAIRILAWPSTGFLNASGRFLTFAMSQGVGAVVFLAAIVTAARSAGPSHAPLAVAAAAAAFFTIEGPACFLLACRGRLGRGAWRAVLNVYSRPLLIGVLAGGAAWAASAVLPATSRGANVLRLLAGGVAGTAEFAIVLRWLAPEVLGEMRRRFLPSKAST